MKATSSYISWQAAVIDQSRYGYSAQETRRKIALGKLTVYAENADYMPHHDYDETLIVNAHGRYSRVKCTPSTTPIVDAVRYCFETDHSLGKSGTYNYMTRLYGIKHPYQQSIGFASAVDAAIMTALTRSGKKPADKQQSVIEEA